MSKIKLFEYMEGKTIKTATLMKYPDKDDTGFLKLVFTDHSFCVISAAYGGYTGASVDEYPTALDLLDPTEIAKLIPCKKKDFE